MQKIKLFLVSVLFMSATCFSHNPGLSVGDALPNPVISILNGYYKVKYETRLYDFKNDDALLIAFIPDISLANPSAKIIATGLNAYFARGLSFRQFEQYRYENPKLKVLVVTPNPGVIVREQIEKYDLDFYAVSDESMNTANFFGINKWGSPNDASQIYIADKDNRIVYARTDYMGEGEKLKEIQANLYAIFELKENLSSNEYRLLIQGDKAREFDFEFISNALTAGGNFTASSGKLSDYTGRKKVLIAFYPAPYSLSCSGEVARFDSYSEEKLIDRIGSSLQDEVELLMVSISNQYILEKWKKDMNLKNVKLVSDYNGEISMKYNSYNTFGWNKRTVFLINKEGDIDYIDWDYNVDDNSDFEILKEQITASN